MKPLTPLELVDRVNVQVLGLVRASVVSVVVEGPLPVTVLVTVVAKVGAAVAKSENINKGKRAT